MKVRELTKAALLFIILLSATGSYAAVKSVPANNGDHRIRMWNYQPNTVFEYTGYMEYAARIELDPKETINSITMGDQSDWQINPEGSTLFIKPTAPNSSTNMTIITDKRTYYFEMYSKEAQGLDDPELVFVTSFNYVDGGDANNGSSADFYDLSSQASTESYVPDPTKSTQGLNLNYTMNGSKTVAPLQVFDDGEFTYFKFKNINADIPALFMVLPDGNEALINYRISPNGYLVVERVTSQFTLRFGNEVVCVFNEANPLKYIGKKKKDENKSFFGVSKG